MDGPRSPKSGREVGYKMCCKTKIPEIHETAKRTVITGVSQPALFPFVSCGTLPTVL